MPERRFHPRKQILIPIEVEGIDVNGHPFRESCLTADASLLGLSFPLATSVEVGTLLNISCKMPSQLRLFDFHKDIYQIDATVRRVEVLPTGERFIGVCFTNWSSQNKKGNVAVNLLNLNI